VKLLRKCQVAILVTVALIAVWPGAARAQGEPAASAEPRDVTVVPSAAAPSPSAAAPSPSAPPSAAAALPPPNRTARPVMLVARRLTPRQTVTGFLRATREGRLAEAASYFDLRGFRWGRHSPPEAAAKLAEVIERRLWLPLSSVSDDPAGDPADGDEYEQLGTIEVEGMPVPIALTRHEAPDGTRYWSFAQVTVVQIHELHQGAEPSWLARHAPESWTEPGTLGLATWQWVGLMGAFLLAFPLGWGIGALAMWSLARIAARTPTKLDDVLVDKTRGPIRFAFGWLMTGGALRYLDLPAYLDGWLTLVVQTPLILASGWLLTQAVRAVTHVIGDAAPREGGKGLHARRIRTQLVMLRKLAIMLIAVITSAVVLLQFDIVRSVGVSLLASAGVAGVALGFAAQKSLGAVIAGVQLSFTQPIRIDDVVVIDQEWGTVEEINLTFVQIKLYDERRLIVPIEHFLSKVFENWSKPGNELVGVVEFAVDPSAPVDRLRALVKAFAEEHPAHDGREAALQVLDLNEHRALMRARVSTSDISKAWAMRCTLREFLMNGLQEMDGGRYLPRRRWQNVSETTEEVSST